MQATTFVALKAYTGHHRVNTKRSEVHELAHLEDDEKMRVIGQVSTEKRTPVLKGRGIRDAVQRFGPTRKLLHTAVCSPPTFPPCIPLTISQPMQFSLSALPFAEYFPRKGGQR